MDDFSYDCMEKKRIASGARHMKRGSKSKKCYLPSDMLTPAQIKKKNGKVIKMDMTKPTSFNDFKTWPEDLQKEYLMRYVNEFGCTITDLAALLNVYHSTLRKHMVDIGFDKKIFTPGKRMSKENRMRFNQWLNTYRPTFEKMEAAKEEPSAKEEVVPVDSNEPVESTIKEDAIMCTPRMCMDFTGILNVHQIANTLLSVAKGKQVKVSVVIEEVTA